MGITQEESVKELASQIFPQGAGIYNIRIIKKDHEDTSPVFLHQDIGYQHGSLERYSFFIPLTKCDRINGGLIFYPGTHHFGYLGDAGAIKDTVLPTSLIPLTPTVGPGDIIVMNSYLWHRSDENLSREDRIYFDIHVNKFDCPANKALFDETVKLEYELDYKIDLLFSNSRLQRLREIST